MSLVTNLVKFCDHSIAWEISVRFFWAKMWPPGLWFFYLHKYSHSFSQFPWLIIQFFQKRSVMTMGTLMQMVLIKNWCIPWQQDWGYVQSIELARETPETHQEVHLIHLLVYCTCCQHGTLIQLICLLYLVCHIHADILRCKQWGSCPYVLLMPYNVYKQEAEVWC